MKLLGLLYIIAQDIDKLNRQGRSPWIAPDYTNLKTYIFIDDYQSTTSYVHVPPVSNKKDKNDLEFNVVMNRTVMSYQDSQVTHTHFKDVL